MFSQRLRSFVLPACLVIGALAGAAATSRAQPPPPDNTKTNQRDRNPGQATADQQQNTRSDLDTTRTIRRAITSDETMSTYAKNIKVITKNGMVTLKGPVRSAEEKAAIEAKAAEVAGTGHVKNHISISKTSATK